MATASHPDARARRAVSPARLASTSSAIQPPALTARWASASNWQVAYKYHLSKRTYVYTGYQKVNNDDNAAYNGSFNSIRKGANPGGFSMGMLHNF